MASFYPDRAAELAMQSDSDESLLDNKSSSDSYSSSEPSYDPASRLKGGFIRHQLAEFPPTEKKKLPMRRCRVCYKNGIRKDTRSYCKECKVPLCTKTCFFTYHSHKSL